MCSKEKEEIFTWRFLFKAHPANLMTKNISLFYENKTTDKTSLCIKYPNNILWNCWFDDDLSDEWGS
jgi:hypothetical protein